MSKHTENTNVPAAAKRTTAELADMTENAARRIVKPYTETDAKLASMVTTLLPFTGKGWSADAILAAVAHTLPASDIPSAFSRSTVSNALAAARAMADVQGNVTASARDGIAAALLRIVRYQSGIGGGVAGMRAALETAVKGTDNGAEIAERLTNAADAVAELDNERRRQPRAVKTRAPHGGALDAGKPDADKTTEPAPGVGKGDASETAESPKVERRDTLQAASVSTLIATLTAKLSSAKTIHPADVEAFDALALIVESLAAESVYA